MKRILWPIILLVSILFVQNAGAQSPPPTPQRVVAGQNTDTVRVKLGAKSFVKFGMTSAGDTTIFTADSNALYISGGGGYLLWANDTVTVGDSVDDDDIVIWFVSGADSGGLQYDFETKTMQYFNDGGVWLPIGSGSGSGTLTYFT